MADNNDLPADVVALKELVIEALKKVFDPEIPVNIYELGLIYDVVIDPLCNAFVQMTLTSPSCPAAVTLPGEVEARTLAVPGIRFAKVEVVWDPPWNPSMMTEAARLELNLL